MLKHLALVASAGALGTLARFGLFNAVARLAPSFPWGTVLVNALGCFGAGLVAALADERLAFSRETRSILLTGFLGGFTTFSAFALETAQLSRKPSLGPAVANVALQVVLGIALVVAGFAAARAFPLQPPLAPGR